MKHTAYLIVGDKIWEERKIKLDFDSARIVTVSQKQKRNLLEGSDLPP